MIFKNLNEFAKSNSICAGCGRELIVTIANGKPNSRNKIPRYIYDNNNMANLDECDWAWRTVYENIAYTCIRKDDDIVYNKFGRDNVLHPLLTINVNDGSIKEEPELSQKIVFEHSIIAYKYCQDINCRYTYFAETENLLLEKVKNKIYPFRINWEGYLARYNDTPFFLGTSKIYGQKSVLLKYSNGNIKQCSLIKELPKIDLSVMRSPEMIKNKIQTILTFQ
jgi:hypothetical protein